MRESFLKRLISTLKCSICGRHYEARNVHILGQQGELWFISVFCSNCGTRGFIAAVIREDNAELNQEELAKFAHSEPIGIDDILDIHNQLKDFSGDIFELFSEK